MLVRTLKSELLPTLGMPTMPAFKWLLTLPKSFFSGGAAPFFLLITALVLTSRIVRGCTSRTVLVVEYACEKPLLKCIK